MALLMALARTRSMLLVTKLFPAPSLRRQFSARPERVFKEYSSSVCAEPLYRYRKGGYHPVHIGDLLHNGRYKVVHKLGHGGRSTVWAAQD